MTRPVPDPIPVRPVDRCRSLLLPHGRPGLDGHRRPTALPAPAVSAGLVALRRDVGLSPRAWAVLEAVVWTWHDDLGAALAALGEVSGPEATLVRLVVARRAQQTGEARRLAVELGRPGWLAGLVPVVAAEGLSGSLTDQVGFRPEAFLGRCLMPHPQEIPALERIQAAEVMLVLQRALGG